MLHHNVYEMNRPLYIECSGAYIYLYNGLTNQNISDTQKNVPTGKNHPAAIIKKALTQFSWLYQPQP